MALVVKNPACQCKNIRDTGSVPGSGRSPGGGYGNPLQFSCLENPMDRGAWWVIVHRVAKSWTWLKQLRTHTHTQMHKFYRKLNSYNFVRGLKLGLETQGSWLPGFFLVGCLIDWARCLITLRFSFVVQGASAHNSPPSEPPYLSLGGPLMLVWLGWHFDH